MIKKISHEVLHAESGVEAIETCRNNPDLDLILMDIKLPNISGFKIVRTIKSLNKMKDIPIIGYLFKRESHLESQKDLMIFVTAHIVKTTSLDLVFNEEDTSVSVETESTDFTIE